MSREKLLDWLHKHLEACQQLHLLEGADSLSLGQLERFSQEVELLSLDLLTLQRKAIATTIEHPVDRPWLEIDTSSDRQQGESLLVKGKVACVILAGGQGSRLGWHGPKALFPILPEKELTLLQILIEKVRKSSIHYGSLLPVAVMTSPHNRAAIEEHALQHHFYGLAPGQLEFFSQSMLPLVDERGDWFLEKPGCIAIGPDGNGGVFSHLKKSGILQQWKASGVEIVTIIPIDNPLAVPFDECLISYQNQTSADVVAECIERIDPEEKIGVFAKSKEKLRVIEYSELSQEQKRATTQEGNLQWPYANINLFSFALPYIEKIAEVSLPWHIARKQALSWLHGQVDVAKCETFLFDVLPFAKNPKLLLCPRREKYAPLKNKEGEKSPATVRAMLDVV